MHAILLVFIIKMWIINTQRYETSAAYGTLFYALNRSQLVISASGIDSLCNIKMQYRYIDRREPFLYYEGHITISGNT